MHSNSKGEILNAGRVTSPRCRNVPHRPGVQAIDISETMLPAPGCRSADGPLLNAWFELNYRLQEEASDTHINKTFIERWIVRLWNIVSPRPQCFWLFLARMNELALLCASKYVDCCEFAAADELLVHPNSIFLYIDWGREAVFRGNEGKRGCIPAEINPGPLMSCLYRLLMESGYITEDYLHSISYRTYKINRVAAMLKDLGMAGTEKIAVKLSCMNIDERRDFQSRLCLFDRRTFNEIGRALHLFMLSGRVDAEYVGKYLRG